MWQPGIEIRTLADVEPFITEGIIIKDRGEYVSVDYTFAGPETFTNPMAHECRGLKFDAAGLLIARPLHKFFNVGERVSPEEIEWSRPHTVFEKLDGSMIHGCILNGRLEFMTRGGISPQAEMALDRAPIAAVEFARRCGDYGQTAIFEFTSPDNRIVVPYDADTLTLLAVRDNLTGAYQSPKMLSDASRRYGIPLAKSFAPVTDVHGFISAARAVVGEEGYVIAFDNGDRLKIKGEDYAFRHKALATIGSEKNVLRLILDDHLDDIVPLLPDAVASRALDAQAEVHSSVGAICKTVGDFHATRKNADRKSYAEAVKREIDPRIMSVAFAAFDGRDVRDAVVSTIRRATSSMDKLDQFRDMIGFSWDVSGIPLDELRG